jgi:hypothetical protein
MFFHLQYRYAILDLGFSQKSSCSFLLLSSLLKIKYNIMSTQDSFVINISELRRGQDAVKEKRKISAAKSKRKREEQKEQISKVGNLPALEEEPEFNDKRSVKRKTEIQKIAKFKVSNSNGLTMSSSKQAMNEDCKWTKYPSSLACDESSDNEVDLTESLSAFMPEDRGTLMDVELDVQPSLIQQTAPVAPLPVTPNAVGGGGFWDVNRDVKRPVPGMDPVHFNYFPIVYRKGCDIPPRAVTDPTVPQCSCGPHRTSEECAASSIGACTHMQCDPRRLGHAVTHFYCANCVAHDHHEFCYDVDCRDKNPYGKPENVFYAYDNDQDMSAFEFGLEPGELPPF